MGETKWAVESVLTHPGHRAHTHTPVVVVLESPKNLWMREKSDSGGKKLLSHFALLCTSSTVLELHEI